MKKFILILLGFLFMNAIFSQSKTDSLIINSLSCLNKKKFLNFEKHGQYILVLYEDYYPLRYYIVDKYYNKEKNSNVQITIIYELSELDSNKYSFLLKLADIEYIGYFYYKKGKIRKMQVDRWYNQ